MHASNPVIDEIALEQESTHSVDRKVAQVSLPHSAGRSPSSESVRNVAEQILKLSIIEISELKTLLQQRLNISDAMLVPAATGTTSVAKADSEENEDDSLAKTSFTLHMKSFADNKKVALIKEIRNIMPDMNLVQAKKFVESLPHVILDNVGKEEAEKVMKQLEDLGGVCLLE